MKDVCARSHAKLMRFVYHKPSFVQLSAFHKWANAIWNTTIHLCCYSSIDHAIFLANCRACLASGCSLRHVLSKVSVLSEKKISLTWNLLAWRAERVAREHYRTSHFQVSQLSFEEISRKTAIMGKDSKESKDIEKVQVEIQVRSVPDGGWGWFICLAGFIAQFVVLGIQNNTGIIYKALLEEFRQSKGETGIYCEFLSICDSTACKP